MRSPRTIDERAVEAAVAEVEDPELNQSIGGLGVLRAVHVGRRGQVTVTLAPPSDRDAIRELLRHRVTKAVTAAAGVTKVTVEFIAMSEHERMDLARKLRAQPATSPIGLGSPTRCYAVASGKGGVGKSSITANLATALAQAGEKVGVLDADVWGYSMPQLFGVRRNPVAIKGLMLPIEAHGVRLISTGFLVDDEAPVIWRGPMLHKALQQFLHDVYWGTLDVLLIDLPPGTGDIMLSLLDLVPSLQLLLVTTPQPAAQTVASRVGRMARDMRVPIAGVIENMSEFACGSCGARSSVFGSGGGDRLADALAVPVVGRVPLDLPLREAGDIGVPVVSYQPAAASAQELRRIAAHLPVARRNLAGVPLPLSVVTAAG